MWKKKEVDSHTVLTSKQVSAIVIGEVRSLGNLFSFIFTHGEGRLIKETVMISICMDSRHRGKVINLSHLPISRRLPFHYLIIWFPLLLEKIRKKRNLCNDSFLWRLPCQQLLHHWKVLMYWRFPQACSSRELTSSSRVRGGSADPKYHAALRA